MKAEQLTINLTQEDLFVVLQYLKTPQMMGLDIQVLQQATEEQIKLALSVAERGLIARTFLQPKENGTLQLDPTIMAIGITCTQPEQSLIISNQPAGKPSELLFFHWHRQMRVIHTVPISGIHQFAVLKDDAAIHRAVEQAVAQTSKTISINDSSITSAVLTDEVIKKTRKYVENGELAIAEKELVAYGATAQFASAFVQTVAQPMFVQINSYLNHLEMSQSQGMTLLQGDKTSWLLKPTMQKQKQSQVSVEIATPDIYQSYILNWLPNA